MGKHFEGAYVLVTDCFLNYGVCFLFAFEITFVTQEDGGEKASPSPLLGGTQYWFAVHCLLVRSVFGCVMIT